MYTRVTWVPDVYLSEAFLTKGFLASFLLTDLLLVCLDVSLFLSFFFFFSAETPAVPLVGVDFVCFCRLLSARLVSLSVRHMW